MFAEKLKNLRALRKITQEEFAREINVTKGAVAMWETGKRTPDIEMLKKIASYFGVSVDELIGNDTLSENNGQFQLEDIYFSFAKSAQEEGIDPEDIELAIKTIKELKRKNKGV